MFNASAYTFVGSPACDEHSCSAGAFDSYFGYTEARACWVRGLEHQCDR